MEEVISPWGTAESGVRDKDEGRKQEVSDQTPFLLIFSSFYYFYICFVVYIYFNMDKIVSKKNLLTSHGDELFW